MKPKKTTKNKNTRRFVEECLLNKEDIYDYSNVVYTNNKTGVEINLIRLRYDEDIKNKLFECL